jgi:hypothetical protein
MKWDDIARKATRTKLWTAIGGGGIGLEIAREGIDLIAVDQLGGILTMAAGVGLTLASVLMYLRVEGNIDKAREEAKKIVTSITSVTE